MLRYDESVTVIDPEGQELGKARMLAWVSLSPTGLTDWQGELQAIQGESFDFIRSAIGIDGLQVQCDDGACARVAVNNLSVETISGTRCTFLGNGPPPRPTP